MSNYKYAIFPAQQAIEDKAIQVFPSSRDYWKLRCNMLEKTLDETYGVAERTFCRNIYKMLANKEV